MIQIIIYGIILSVFIYYNYDMIYLESNSNVTSNVIQDIYNDLLRMFYFTSNTFIYPLEYLNNKNIFDYLTIKESNESYTINKSVINLCVRNPKTYQYYDKNSLMFVTLHELAHVICDEVGHTEKFLSINKALLNYAANQGYYNPKKPFVNNYCPINK